PASAIAVVRQFPFESLLRRMSVVAKTQGSDHFEVFLKGAPELVCSLSTSETVPDNYKEVLEFYTRQGFRVIGVGSRHLDSHISWDEVLKMPRDELEKDLQFQGLVVLQNRLKQETIPTLNILKQADIRTIMVTGDNLLTAITCVSGLRHGGGVRLCDLRGGEAGGGGPHGARVPAAAAGALRLRQAARLQREAQHRTKRYGRRSLRNSW
ncbi:probable cation-transporting ATPase 13A3, partial [Caerostris extrusa]